MKSKEELNALKEEVEALNKKLAELTDEELEQVSGGVSSVAPGHPSELNGGDRRPSARRRRDERPL